MKKIILFILMTFTSPTVLFAEEDPRAQKRKELSEAIEFMDKEVYGTKPTELIKTLDAESKAIGFQQFPFSETFAKLVEQEMGTGSGREKLRSAFRPIYVEYMMQRFTDSELEDIIAASKNPIVIKHTKFFYYGWIPSLLDVLKDPKLFELYELNLRKFVSTLETFKSKKPFDEVVQNGIKEFAVLENTPPEKMKEIEQKLQQKYGHLVAFSFQFMGMLANPGLLQPQPLQP